MLRRQAHPVIAQLRPFGLPRDEAERLGRLGTALRIPAGTTFCKEGERGLQAFLILEGEAKVLTADSVVTIGPGDVVGELATLDRRRTRNATVVAQDDLEVLVYDVRTFRHLSGDPALRPLLVPERASA